MELCAVPAAVYPVFFPLTQAMVKSNRGTVGGFFLAGRDVAWWPVSGPEVSGDKFIHSLSVLTLGILIVKDVLVAPF